MEHYGTVSFIIAIITAIITFLLALLEDADKRRKIVGIQIKNIKKYFAFATLILFLIALFIQRKQNDEESSIAMRKDYYQDSLQRNHFNITLKAVDSTLLIQNSTLDSTKLILYSQRNELVNEIAILKKQELALRGNTLLIKGQNKELSDIANVIYNTDPIIGSKLRVYWSFEDSAIDNSIINTNKISSSYLGLVGNKAPNNGYILGGKYLDVPVEFYQIAFLFTEKMDQDKLIKLIQLDLLKNDITYALTPMTFDNLKPIIEIRSLLADKPSDIEFGLTNRFKGRGWENLKTYVTFSGSVKYSFDYLDNLQCVVVIIHKNPIDIPSLTLENRSNSKYYNFYFDKAISSKIEIRNSVPYYLDIYSAYKFYIPN